MKFTIGLAILVLVAAQSFGQSCSGRGGLFAFQGTRERHVVRSFGARGGCSGSVALVPWYNEWTARHATTWAVAPQAAPAKPMPVANGPVTIQVHPPNFSFQTEEPRRAPVRAVLSATVDATARVGGGLIQRIVAILHRLRPGPKEVHREFHFLRCR